MNKKILLVDDDTDFLFQVKLQLEKFEFDVITADTQKEAEEIIQKEKPDLAIIDLMMESEDSGFILSYKLRKKYPDVPIIIATSVSAETGIFFGLESDEERQWINADLYLEKDVTPEQLHKEILKLLKI
jgi:two-component system, OmpR family, response regulator